MANLLDGERFSQMVYLGAANLRRQAKAVDALNVFPVPDGDTGTNMNLTMMSGVEELARKDSRHLGESAQALAKGLLMGARGNSGVILSQLFRGFSKAVADKQEIHSRQFAEALKAGVDSAYQAVMKPVEGTILTVAREAAEVAVRVARGTDDIGIVMEKAYEAALQSLSRTPELLPVLKEVGVVDSGGQGLVFILEGFVRSLRGETIASEPASQPLSPADLDRLVAEQHRAQAHLKTEEIRYGYCTEFMVQLGNRTESGKKPFVEAVFRTALDQLGDSLLVISDEELVKVHIHTEHPGEVLNYAQRYGSLHRIKIDNMREQHARIVEETREQEAGSPAAGDNDDQRLPYGLIAVAAGDGMADIFKSLGVHVVVQGGQTMNPSTEDFVRAIHQCNAEKVIILPNNSNIVMAAEQAAELVSVPVAVIPTKSFPQGMAALVAFNGGAELEENRLAMTEASRQVKTGLVTTSVRDTRVGDVEMKAGEFIGIADGTIVMAHRELVGCAVGLMQHLVHDDTGIVTIIYGQDAAQEQVAAVEREVASAFPDVEVEVLRGGQPLYPFIFSVE